MVFSVVLLLSYFTYLGVTQCGVIESQCDYTVLVLLQWCSVIQCVVMIL